MTVSYGYYGGAIGDMLNQWAQMGFFSYLLPFLLIFSVVFGLLGSIKIFKGNKSVDAIIALAIGLLALQFDMVPIFFSQVFPRLGIALAVILVVLILAGLFMPIKTGWVTYVLMAIGIIAAAVVLIGSAGNLGFGGYFWYTHWQTIVFIVIFMALIGIVVGASNPKPKHPIESIWSSIQDAAGK